MCECALRNVYVFLGFCHIYVWFVDDNPMIYDPKHIKNKQFELIFSPSVVDFSMKSPTTINIIKINTLNEQEEQKKHNDDVIKIKDD